MLNKETILNILKEVFNHDFNIYILEKQVIIYVGDYIHPINKKCLLSNIKFRTYIKKHFNTLQNKIN